MPLTGELEHLPIVDVIQLIHSTRKSGTLNVYSRKGEGQLVFNAGYIVGATHSSEKLRIGQILSEAEIITPADLDKALAIQESAGDNRKPLISTLLDQCGLSKEQAFKALETLIELTIVEMISWNKGIFSFEVDKIHISDEYRYLPTQLQELNLDTQMVLMDALRIFDEKVHAGEIKVVDEPLDEMPDLESTATNEIEPEEEISISEDILGLADLDKVERRKPHVFKSLEVFNPAEIHRQEINSALPELAEGKQTHLADFLTELAKPELSEGGILGSPTSQSLIMLSCDPLTQHGVRTICQKENVLFFTTSEKQELDSFIERSLDKNLEPIIVIDNQQGLPEDVRSAIDTDLIDLFQIVSISETNSAPNNSLSAEAIFSGDIRSICKPVFSEQNKETFVEEFIGFLNYFKDFLHNHCKSKRRQYFSSLLETIEQIQTLSRPQEISLAVLQYIGQMFDRTLTLIVDKNELIAERSIGVTSERDKGVAAAQKFRLQLSEESLFNRVISESSMLFESSRDSSLSELFHEIGAPLESKILLAPMICYNRTITINYADFGNEPSRPVAVDLIKYCTTKAGAAMAKALVQKSTTPQK